MNERRPSDQPGSKDERSPEQKAPTPAAKKPDQSKTMDNSLTETTKPNDAALSRQVQAKLGQQLRAYYERLIEPTPDRFVDLLSRLDKPGSKEPSE